MAKKTTPKVVAVEAAPVPVLSVKFVPCRQCGNPGDCTRAAKCRKGFK
jgi:hypothetical protein